jgi:hypothetical protein
MGFPKALVYDILTCLRDAFSDKNKSPSRTDDKIEKGIMKWYAKIFGHYAVYGEDVLSTKKSRKLLSQSHPSPEVREFLGWFVETGILQSFFFNHVSVIK